jgi:hypothetical protein
MTNHNGKSFFGIRERNLSVLFIRWHQMIQTVLDKPLNERQAPSAT